MKKAIFITGTDTGVGKTIVTAFLGRMLKEKGVKVITQKWVQTGCRGFSEDIDFHMKFMKSSEYYPEMAPYIFEFPSSPHLAARLEEKCVSIKKIESSFHKLSEDFDVVLIEGSGGVLVPVNEENMIIDILGKLSLKSLVVAENRLGAINQTLLTLEAFKSRGLGVLGVLFNRTSPEKSERILKDNVRIVEKFSSAKIFGELKFNKDTDMLYEEFLPIGEEIIKKL